MTRLAAPTGESLLLKAYRAVAEKQEPEAAELVAEFQRYFVATVPPHANNSQVFERFSLVDPGILTVLRANTAST